MPITRDPGYVSYTVYHDYHDYIVGGEYTVYHTMRSMLTIRPPKRDPNNETLKPLQKFKTSRPNFLFLESALQGPGTGLKSIARLFMFYYVNLQIKLCISLVIFLRERLFS